jgi:hypothetical protein
MSKYNRWSREGMPEGDALRRIQQNIDATMRGAIADARRGISQSASMIPDHQRADESPRAPSGGTVPIEQPPGVNYVDQLCDAQDRIDRAALIKRKMEAEWVTRLESKNDE